MIATKPTGILKHIAYDLAGVAGDTDLDRINAAVAALTDRPIDLLIETAGAAVVQQHINTLTAAWFVIGGAVARTAGNATAETMKHEPRRRSRA